MIDRVEGLDADADQTIIDAIMSEGKGLLRELNRRGLSTEVVRARAGQLGLTRDFVRKCRLAGTKPSMRECRRCDAVFLSAGAQNRVCRRCHARS